ncbi:MAG TPA: FAD:protein FMN transferase [Ilumatobacter sp.]|nr:FAD:protein FMN transferase [Ilumatobacter sp.]
MAADLAVPVARRAYRAMSCTAHVVVVGANPSPLLQHVEQRLDEIERRWSRFLADSEISGLNAAGGAPRRCSSDTVTLVEAMVRAWRATDGAFDPTLLGTLVELGYVSSRSDATARTSLAGDVRPVGRPDLVCVEPTSGVVQLPAGTSLDPGGIGKGLAADLIVAELLDLGAEGALIEIGGDLRIAGRAPVGHGWPVEIRSAGGGRPTLVRLRSGGIATSSSRLRTWPSPGGDRHHLLDPRTLRPTSDDVIGCTVIAGSAAWAEAFTKVAFVDGCSQALSVYDRLGLAARVTTDDGHVHHSTAWEVFGR